MLGSEAESVVSLIIAGLTERWGTYTGHFNGDLANFLETYGRSLVLVAVRDLRVVGVGILQRVDATSAQIVRMSVARECRRQACRYDASRSTSSRCAQAWPVEDHTRNNRVV